MAFNILRLRKLRTVRGVRECIERVQNRRASSQSRGAPAGGRVAETHRDIGVKVNLIARRSRFSDPDADT